jgi:hypothetical protein
MCVLVGKPKLSTTTGMQGVLSASSTAPRPSNLTHRGKMQKCATGNNPTANWAMRSQLEVLVAWGVTVSGPFNKLGGEHFGAQKGPGTREDSLEDSRPPSLPVIALGENGTARSQRISTPAQSDQGQ